MRLTLCAPVVFVAVLVAGAPSHLAQAAVIPGITSLQDLINLGPLQANGVQIGNDVFYNFTYSGSPAPGAAGAPTPATILVTSTDSGPGLEFAFPWSSTMGNNEDSLISYAVHVVDTTPQQFINSATLDFQSSVTATSLADNSTATQTLGDSNGHVPFAEQTVINTGSNPVQPISSSLPISPGLRDLGVSDDIAAHSAAGSTGTSSITYVDNIFGQSSVPEPGASAILSLGAGAVLRRRRQYGSPG